MAWACPFELGASNAPPMDLTHVRFQGTPPRRPGRNGPHCAVPHPAQGSAALALHFPTTVSGLPAFVLERAGLDPALYREAPLRRRTSACLRAIRAESEQVALARLRIDSQLADVALDAFLIGVSQFFRDPMVFETLRTTTIPALAARARPLRVASIGCSSGAELYSVAMCSQRRASWTDPHCSASIAGRRRSIALGRAYSPAPRSAVWITTCDPGTSNRHPRAGAWWNRFGVTRSGACSTPRATVRRGHGTSYCAET